MTPKEIAEKLTQLTQASRAIVDAADVKAGGPGKGVLSAEDDQKIAELNAEYDTIKAEADAVERRGAQDARHEAHEAYMAESTGRRTAPLTPDGGQAGADGGEGEPITMEFRGETITLDPRTRQHATATPEYRQAFASYLIGQAQAGLQAAPDTQGGYLVPAQVAYELLKSLDDECFMRAICNVLPPLSQAGSLGQVTLDTGMADASWSAEVPAAAVTENDSLRLGKRELTPHLLTTRVKLSMLLMRSAAINPETILREELARIFSETEEKAYLLGTGSQQPLGVFVASDDGIPTSRDVTTASSTAVVADEFVDMYYNLKGGHAKDATWLLHRDCVKRVRKLKDSDGQYIWQPGLQAGQPDLLLGLPIAMSEFAPNTFTAAQYVAILGNFKRGYWIVDALDLAIQRLGELYAETNQVGFIARKQTDGAPVLAEAFTRLKMKP